jgi:hypothetical protein
VQVQSALRRVNLTPPIRTGVRAVRWLELLMRLLPNWVDLIPYALAIRSIHLRERVTRLRNPPQRSSLDATLAILDPRL